jgi:flagellar hook-associated protein 2
MSGVYNHFLTSYASSDTTRADTHKKNELKDIYKSIVRISKESPLYLIKRDDGVESRAIALKESARKLQGELAFLKNENNDSFGSRIAITSDEEAVNVSYIGGPASETPSFEMDVKELALPQINTGYKMPDTRTTLEPGSYYFDARIIDQNYEFQFSIGADDTNSDILKRIASLINKAAVGLTAEVNTDQEQNTSISIISKATGRQNGQARIFDIKDALNSPRHGIVSYFGLDQTTQMPSNSVFNLNGEERTSSSNHFTVGGVYEIKLKDKSAQTISIGTKSDGDTAVDNVRHLVDSFNSFLDIISGIKGGNINTHRIMNEVNSSSASHRHELEALGFKRTEDGHITFDPETLKALEENDENEDQLQPVKDFADSLSDMTKAIMLDPMKFTDMPVVNYKNPGHESVYPYVTSEYSGMLFNNYC